MLGANFQSGRLRWRLGEPKLAYNQGHAPAHLLGYWRPGGLAGMYLGGEANAAARRHASEVFSAHYGRVYDPGIWPADERDVRLIADVTGLMTAHHLDILDKIERAVKPIRIGPDTMNAIENMRQDLDEMIPDRLEAM